MPIYFRWQSEIPGPGTYGEGGIPHSAVEKKSRESTSTVGMLDAGSSTPRHLPSVVSLTVCHDRVVFVPVKPHR